LLRTERPIPTACTFLQPKPACAGVRGHGCLLQRGESYSWPAAEECGDNGQQITQSQRQPLPFIIRYGRAVKVLIWAPVLLELLWLYWFIKDSHFSGLRIGLAVRLELLYCDNCPRGGDLWSRLAICLLRLSFHTFSSNVYATQQWSLAHITPLQAPLWTIVMLRTSCLTQVECPNYLGRPEIHLGVLSHWPDMIILVEILLIEMKDKAKVRSMQLSCTRCPGHQQWAPLSNIAIKRPDGTVLCGSSWTPGTDVTDPATDRHWAWRNTSHNRHNQSQLKASWLALGFHPYFCPQTAFVFFMWQIKTSIYIIFP